MLSRIDGNLSTVQLLTDFQQLAHHLCHLLGFQQRFQRVCFLHLLQLEILHLPDKAVLRVHNGCL